MLDRMTWRIILRAGRGAAALPTAILTMAPRFRHESMPDEVGLLLPTNAGPDGMIDAVAAAPETNADTVLGLFLAGPFLNAEVQGARLRRAGVRWIANLPSVEQQDPELARQLDDAALGRSRELRCLGRFRELGFRLAAVVVDGAGATAAAVAPDAMLVMPRVADFAAGFPSLRQRGTAAQAVADAARAAGWSGTLLGLGEAQEAEHQGLWPAALDGLVCRPTPVPPAGQPAKPNR